MKITKQDLNKFFKTKESCSGFEENIGDKIDFIIHEIFSDIDWWAWSDDAPEGGMGTLTYDDKFINIYIKKMSNKKCIKARLEDGTEFIVEQQIPITWLYANDYLLEYDECINRYENFVAKKKAKKKTNKSKLISSIKSKLTKEEIEVLGLK